MTTSHPCLMMVSSALWLLAGVSPSVPARSHTGSIPWAMVAGQPLDIDCSSDPASLTQADARGRSGWLARSGGGSDSYAFQPDRPIVLALPDPLQSDRDCGRMQVHLALWTGASWSPLGDAPAMVTSDRITLDHSPGRRGLFKLTLDRGGLAGRVRETDVYFIATDNWKLDLLSYCRSEREQIEISPDPELLRSAVAVSHWDDVMTLIAGTPTLSEQVLRAVKRGVDASTAFHAGECPDLVVGLNKIRWRRFPGAKTEEFVVCVPEGSEHGGSPIFLHTDNQRWASVDQYRKRSGLIDVWWHTVTHTDVEWKSCRALLDLLRQKLHVDEDRMYINGECRNGLAAMSLALNHPDRWAECSVSLCSTYRDLAGNARNMDMIFVKGIHNEDWALGSYNFAVQCFTHFGCERLVQSRLLSTEQARGERVPRAVRVRKPAQIFHSIESLGNSRAYWVRIDGREDENFVGRIEVQVRGQTIDVRASNVDAYTLYLADAPVAPDEPIALQENGLAAGPFQGRTIARRSGKYAQASSIKNERLHGPVWDALTEAYVVVWGTASGWANEPERTMAEAFAKGAPCYGDTAAPAACIDTHNVVLVGRPHAGRWPHELLGRLPLRIEDREIAFAGKCYRGQDLGMILVHPNPLNPERYAAVLSATSDKAFSRIMEAYDQMRAMRPADIGIFEVGAQGAIRWHVFEKLNTVWGWHADWDAVLAHAKRTHAPWQWRQWAARVMREVLKGDVALCENPLRFPDETPVGPITYRDICNLFLNHWVVKIELTGRQLQSLLMAPVADVSEKMEVPAADGIRFGNAAATDEPGLVIGGLTVDGTYTLVCNSKCVSDARGGRCLNDYRIVDQAYLAAMLRRHLLENQEADIDAELDGLTRAMY